MLKWLRAGLAKYDKVHLNGEGYKVKGELYLNAMLNAYLQLIKAELKDTFLVKNSVAPVEFVPSSPDTTQKFIPPPKNNGQPHQVESRMIIHKIRSGETLGGIAIKYGVTVSQIKQWNNMSSSKLIAGKTLKIYVKSGNESTGNTNSSSNNAGAVKTYKVRSGDSLWSIAQKFGTTVEELKRLNHLNKSSLHPGMKLVVAK